MGLDIRISFGFSQYTLNFPHPVNVQIQPLPKSYGRCLLLSDIVPTFLRRNPVCLAEYLLSSVARAYILPVMRYLIGLDNSLA